MHRAAPLAWRNLHFGGAAKNDTTSCECHPVLKGVAMLRTLAFAAGFAASQVVFPAGLVAATEFATPEDARASLDRAVVAMKQDEAKALEMFASGEGGFK